jgi:hypothetical protein
MSYAYQVTVTGIHNYRGEPVQRSNLWHFTQQVWGSVPDSVPSALSAMGEKFFSYYPDCAIALPQGRSGIVIVKPSAAGRLKDYVQDPHALDTGRYFVQNDYAVIYVKELPAMSGDFPDQLQPDDPNAFSDELDKNLESGPDFESVVHMPGKIHTHPASHLRYNGAVYKLARKLVMYHGTATGKNGEILHSILKHGLIPETDKRAYDSPYSEDGAADFLDFNTRFTISLDESFGGIYTTMSLGEAKSYAKNAVQQFGGDPVLIASRVETRTPGTTIDEDLLFGEELLQFLSSSIPGNSYEQLKAVVDGDVDFVALAKHYLEAVFGDYSLSAQELSNALPDFSKAVEARFLVELAGRNWAEIEREAFDANDYDTVEFLDVDEYISDYREYGQESLKKLKSLSGPSEQRGLHKTRFTSSPIGYRGANRILAIVSADAETVRIHYSYDVAAAQRLAEALGATHKTVQGAR